MTSLQLPQLLPFINAWVGIGSMCGQKSWPEDFWYSGLVKGWWCLSTRNQLSMIVLHSPAISSSFSTLDFSTWAPLTFLAGQFFIGGGRCPVNYRIFSNILGLCPLDIRSKVPLSRDNQKFLHTLLNISQRAKSSHLCPVENHWVTLTEGKLEGLNKLVGRWRDGFRDNLPLGLKLIHHQGSAKTWLVLS